MASFGGCSSPYIVLTPTYFSGRNTVRARYCKRWDFPPGIQKPSANLVASSTLIWVGNSYCDFARSARGCVAKERSPCIMFSAVFSAVPLLQCDQDLDYTMSFHEWLQRFAHNSSSHPVSISSLHRIACFVGRNQKIARSNVSVFSCDF